MDDNTENLFAAIAALIAESKQHAFANNVLTDRTLVGAESPEGGPPRKPPGNTEGSLNPFSLSGRVNERCDLARGGGHFGIAPGHAGAAKEGPGSKSPGPVEQGGSAVNVRSRLELGLAPHAKRLLRAGLSVGAPWLLGASVGRLEG